METGIDAGSQTTRNGFDGAIQIGEAAEIPLSPLVVEKRYRIETVFGQLVDRYHAKKVWARDLWHLTSRWFRKILSHTIAVLFCQQHGLSPLRFSELLTQ